MRKGNQTNKRNDKFHEKGPWQVEEVFGQSDSTGNHEIKVGGE